MTYLRNSDIVWAAWLILFLVLELTAFFGLVPWHTLSETSWVNEKTYPVLRIIVGGFLIGLAVHIMFQTGLWRTTLGGIVIAVVLFYLWTVKVGA